MEGADCAGEGKAARYCRKLHLTAGARALLPPIALTAIAGNEAVTLDWIPAVDIRTRGYRISYGTAPGRYTDFIDIDNPPFTPNRHQQLTITGLQNDVLYYFSVQSFDDAPVRQYGEFSDEISARPGLIHKQP